MMENIISEETHKENLKTVIEELKPELNMKKISVQTKSKQATQPNTDDEVIS